MRAIGYSFLVVYAILAAAACYLAWGQANHNVDDFSKIAAVYLTLLTSLLAAIITFINVNRQWLVSQDLEKLKGSLAADVEAIKIDLSVESKAYDDLLRAMEKYYRALAVAEAGEWDKVRVDDADRAMQDAEYQATRIHEACASAFINYWQRARLTKESLERVNTPDQRKQVWKVNVKELASLSDAFVYEFKKYHRTATIKTKAPVSP